MNVALDPTNIFNGIIGILFLAVSFMIKHELVDIKFRITRLENVFIKPTIKE